MALLDARDAAAVLVGAGLGALVALDLALRHPELALGLVLVEPPALGLVPEATELLSADRVTLTRSGARRRRSTSTCQEAWRRRPGSGQAAPQLTGQARDRPRILFAELRSHHELVHALSALREAELPALIVTAPSTPHLLRKAAGALGAARRQSQKMDEERMAPHLGDPDGVGALALELAGA